MGVRMADSEDLTERLREAGVDMGVVQQLAQQLADQKATNRIRHRSPESVAKLREFCEAFHRPSTLKVGDVVRWKQGLRNKRTPAYDSPVVVFEILETPLFDPEKEGGSQYFHERLDLVIGFFPEEELEAGEEASVNTYHVDSRRFEVHPDFS
jgi:hypothetical protein